MPAVPTRSEHTMTRLDIHTGQPFEEFVRAFEQAAPPFDAAAVQRISESGGGWADVVSAVAANAPLTRSAELAAVRGFSAAAFARVSPYVVALPSDAGVNVNTAPAEVLAALLPSLDADAIAAIVAMRREKPFATIDDFRTRVSRGGAAPDTTGVTVGSRHFLVTVRAKQGNAIVLAEAQRNGARLPLTALVDQFYAQVMDRGGRRWDTSSLIHLLANP